MWCLQQSPSWFQHTPRYWKHWVPFLIKAKSIRDPARLTHGGNSSPWQHSMALVSAAPMQELSSLSYFHATGVSVNHILTWLLFAALGVVSHGLPNMQNKDLLPFEANEVTPFLLSQPQSFSWLWPCGYAHSRACEVSWLTPFTYTSHLSFLEPTTVSCLNAYFSM